MKNIILFVEGGRGKVVASTAVVRCLKKANPDSNIIVLSGSDDVFMGNPNVYRHLRFYEDRHFYDNYIIGHEATVFKFDQYSNTNYINRTKHLIDVMCDQCGVENDGLGPEIFLMPKEIAEARQFIGNKPKPVMLIQFEGGAPPSPEGKANQQPQNRGYVRDLPIEVAMGIVNYFKDKYRILQIMAETQTNLSVAEKIVVPIKPIAALTLFADKIVCIDSMLQHIAAATKKEAIVIWGGTSPDVLGYPIHKNIRTNVCPTPECGRPNGQAGDNPGWMCEFGEACMYSHSIQKLISEIEG